MRAAVLHECPGWLDITDLDVGTIGPHEVLVQTQAAGLCHSDLHCIEGTLPSGARRCSVTSRRASSRQSVPRSPTSGRATT